MRIKKYLGRITALILIVAMCFMSTACNSMDKERQDAVSSDLTETYKALSAAFDEADDTGEMQDAIVAFAKDNGMSAENKDGYVIVTKKGQTKKTIGLHASISKDTDSDHAVTAASILTAMTNADNTNTVRAIFTADNGGSMDGAAKVAPKYIKGTPLISLTYDNGKKYYTTSASADVLDYTTDVNTVDVKGLTAYTLRISRLGGEPAYKSDDDLNPIIIMVNILNSFQDSHIDFQLVSFKTTGDELSFPEGVSMVICVDPSDTTKMTKIVDRAKKNFYEKCVDVYGPLPEKIDKELNGTTDSENDETASQAATAADIAHMSEEEKAEYRKQLDEERKEAEKEAAYAAAYPSFTIAQISTVPSESVSKEDVQDLTSMIYVLNDAFDYLNKDDEDNKVGKNDFTSLSVTTEGVHLTLCNHYKDGKKHSQAESILRDLAQLNGYSCKVNPIREFWQNSDPSMLVTTFTDTCGSVKYNIVSDDTFQPLETGVFAKKNGDAEQLTLTVNEETALKTVEALIVYLEDPDSSAN